MTGIATPSMIGFARALNRAAAQGVWAGDATDAVAQAYFAACRATHESGATAIFTRDTGHHTSGWWKNPEYERCLHLSLSFWDLERRLPRPAERGEAEAWVRLFFGPFTRLVWEESAVSTEGQAKGVCHYRVFCDERWRPIKPRGEVYSTQLTALGWKSWSEVQATRRVAS